MLGHWKQAMIGGAALLGVLGLAACHPAPKTLAVTRVSFGEGSTVTDAGFTANGSMFFVAQPGRIELALGDGSSRVLQFVDDVIDASPTADSGLTGIAVDPDFSTNRRIYTCQLSADPAVRRLDVRVVRWRVSNDATSLTNRTDIMTGIPAISSFPGSGSHADTHTACRPRFGPDGNLWIGTGDAYDPSAPQSTTSLAGKVLRVDTDGNPVAGNAPAPFDPRIYSYGHRVVRNVAFDGTGRAYAVEESHFGTVEVNRLVAGGNYGWDPYSGPFTGTDPYDDSRPITDTARHPDAEAAVWTSSVTQRPPGGGTFLSGKQWSGWNGSLVVTVGGQQTFVAFKADGVTVDETWAKTYEGDSFAVQAPDGALHLGYHQFSTRIEATA